MKQTPRRLSCFDKSRADGWLPLLIFAQSDAPNLLFQSFMPMTIVVVAEKKKSVLLDNVLKTLPVTGIYRYF